MDSTSSAPQDVESVFYELSLKNRLDELATLSDWINTLASQLGISSRGTFRLDLVLAEAVTNIIENAYGDEAEHKITVRLQYGECTIRVQVKDDGLPFDPLQSPEVVFPSLLEEATEGGLGIHLIRSYTSECHYRREGNENILAMVICDSE